MEKRPRNVSGPLDYDPDEFVLTKRDVLDFIDAVLGYWGRTATDKLKNLKLIAGMELMKGGVMWTGDEDFKIIWSLMLRFIAIMQYENAIKKSFQDGETFGETIKMIKSELRDKGLEEFFRKYKR